MKIYGNAYLCVAASALLLIAAPQPGHAAKKKKPSRGTVVTESDISSRDIEFSYKTVNSKGKKKNVSRTATVSCYNGKAGTVKQQKDGSLRFTAFNTNSIKAKIKKGRGNTAKLQIALKATNSKKKAGNAACSGEDNTINTSLDPFTGTFGAKEARILGERFCFSFTPSEVAQAVSEGLDATVARIQAYNENATHISYPGNPLISELFTDIKCDGYIKGEETDGSNDGAEEECNLNNPIDRDMEGVRDRLYLEAFGQNCYHAKMAFFLHDEIEAATLAFASSDSRYRHFAESYLNDLWEAAKSGNFAQYIKDIFIPTEGSGYASAVLNVVRNINLGALGSPNEDGARELFELGTVGYKPYDNLNTLDPNEFNYGPLDIANNALAFTGWVWSTLSLQVGEAEPVSILAPAFSSAAFTPGNKVLFGSDPNNSATVVDMEDSIEAALAHSNTPYELARKICKEFIASSCSTALIKKLGDIVIEENFNLNRIMARVMKSEALYNGDTEEALIKHPIEYFLGFLRAIEFPLGKEPISMRDIEDRFMERTSQRAFLPPTIFGFYPAQLAGEGRVLDRRRACYETLKDDAQSLAEDTGYSIREKFMTNLPSGSTDSLRVIQKISDTLNVSLTPDQISTADAYLNYYRDSNCEQWEVNEGYCTQEQLGEEYARRDAFDLLDPSYDFVRRVQGLLIMFCQLYDYQTK